jgi:phenylalanyl-tRNA synthetase beta chain
LFRYTTEEFEQLCFDFGIELDEDTSTTERPIINGKQEPAQLKIEIPANRYDMLCFEGIALMLNIFRQKQQYPNYRLVVPKSGKLETLTVHPDTAKVRPYVSAAILRDITFTQASYDSFIALQDKLHQNLARNRTLVAIGTHDLDTIKGPFTYEALPPKDISFISLNQTKKRTAEEMMEFYEKDKHLGQYLHIIRDEEVYPVIYDSQKIVCSMPPIINGEHSKITMKTKNVLIEMTGTDRTKLEIVNRIMVSMFSQYCGVKYTIEPVQIVSEHNGETRITPDLTPQIMEAEVDYINSRTGLPQSPEEICKLLTKMCLSATPSTKDANKIIVSVPPTRADVFHQCDVMEDVAIAYNFNSLPIPSPLKSSCVGKPLPLNMLADLIREEVARNVWDEVMPLTLCSHDENFSWLNRKDDGATAVVLANPKTAEYQIVRTSLLPGLLKVIRENRHHKLPYHIFETGDITIKDPSLERKARNVRHFAAAYYGKKSEFELVHTLLDRLMVVLQKPHLSLQERGTDKKSDGYWIEEIDEPTFISGRAAAIHVRLDGKEARIGELGVLRPDAAKNYNLDK